MWTQDTRNTANGRASQRSSWKNILRRAFGNFPELETGQEKLNRGPQGQAPASRGQLHPRGLNQRVTRGDCSKGFQKVVYMEFYLAKGDLSKTLTTDHSGASV